jgi:hypothetical protein
LEEGGSGRDLQPAAASPLLKVLFRRISSASPSRAELEIKMEKEIFPQTTPLFTEITRTQVLYLC